MELSQLRESQLPFEANLPDGTNVLIRLLTPDDEVGLRASFAVLSQETRYQRFHVPVHDLSDSLWRYLSSPDGVDHVALVAIAYERIIGVARLVQLSWLDDTAEMAFVVADEFQRRRVGSLLRDELMRIVQRRRLRCLHGYVLPHNLAIRRLLAIPMLQLAADRGDLLAYAVRH